MRSTFIFLFSVLFIRYAAGQCYSTDRYRGEGQRSEIGYVGQLNGKNLYYEVWSEPGSINYYPQSLLLWTDTTELKKFDFCISCSAEHPEQDSIHINDDRNGPQIEYTTAINDVKKVPGLFQVLKCKENGIGQYSGFNYQNKEPKIYIKQNQLYISYFWNPRYDTPQYVTEIYSLKNGQFELVNHIIKIIK